MSNRPGGADKARSVASSHFPSTNTHVIVFPAMNSNGIMIKPRYVCASVVAFLLLVNVFISAAPVPQQLSDEQFWKMATEFSEDDGFFRSDNLLSNETTFQNVIPDILKIAKNVLGAKIALAKKDNEGAITMLRQAVVIQDSLKYNEPPDWFFPVRESLGAVLLSSGNAVEAEKVFRAEITKHLRNGRALFGLAESLKRQGKTSAAITVEREYRQAWSNSDTKLSINGLVGINE